MLLQSLVTLVVLGSVSTARAAPYDQLFEPGKRWSYRETREVWYGVDQAKATRDARTVACSVAGVKRIATATVATIECDHDSLIAGTWVATKRGLWHTKELVDTKHAVWTHVKGTPMLAAKPRVIARRESGDGLGKSRGVSREGKTWCVEEADGDAQAAWWSTTCFAGGAILTRTANSEWYSEGGGGTERRAVLQP